MYDRPGPTLPPGARIAWCDPCNVQRVRLSDGRCLACLWRPGEVREFTVARTVTVHAASSEKAAAVEYFEATGETPGPHGTTVQVDGRNVVVWPHEVPDSEPVSSASLGVRRMDAQQYAERYVR